MKPGNASGCGGAANFDIGVTPATTPGHRIDHMGNATERHLGRPEQAKPETLAIALWARLASQWQSTMLLFQPNTILRWHREVFRIAWWTKPNRSRALR